MNNPAYKRFIIVVGVKAALEAVNEQANILRDLAFETRDGTAAQRACSPWSIARWWTWCATSRPRWNDHKLLYARKKKERDIHEELLEKAESGCRSSIRSSWTTARNETAEHLKELRKLSDALFAERVKLRDNTEANQQLENRHSRSGTEGR